MFNTLSGRFLILTVVFVMLAEVLIFVPSIARFRVDYLNTRIERAQIASLALLADDMLAPELEAELLQNAGVYNVVLLRNETRQLVLSSALPSPVSDTYDLRNPRITTLISDALYEVMRADDRIIRAVGLPKLDGGDLIEITLDAGPLQHAMRDYGLRILWLSAIISIFTALLLNIVVRWLSCGRSRIWAVRCANTKKHRKTRVALFNHVLASLNCMRLKSRLPACNWNFLPPYASDNVWHNWVRPSPKSAMT